MTFSYTFDRENRHITIEEGSTEIPPRMFQNEQGFDTIQIPDSIKSIGARAFEGTYLREVKIPDSVEFIGDNAFHYAWRLMSAVLPKNLEEIERWTFQNCTSLSSVVWPANLKRIDDRAFDDTDLDDKIISSLPDSLEFIGNGAFSSLGSGGRNLMEITLPESLITIEENAFRQNQQLQRVVFGSSIETIGDSAFRNTFIRDVNLPLAMEENPPFAAYLLALNSHLVKPLQNQSLNQSPHLNQNQNQHLNPSRLQNQSPILSLTLLAVS